MFGYVRIHKDELKVKEFEYYKACYCGLCGQLRKEYGQAAGFFLNFDMTFLTIFLSSLYEQPYEKKKIHCVKHFGKKHRSFNNEFTAYAAQMTILLTYQSLLDNWKDEKSILSKASAMAIHKKYKITAKNYPRQAKAVETLIRDTNELEANQNLLAEEKLELLSSVTGRMLQEIFLYKEDIWKETIGQFAFYLGKFIYVLDAYDDLEKDKKAGSFNPLILLEKEEGFEERIKEILNLLGAMCAKQFEKLPIIENAALLRNIIYSGIWEKYEEARSMKVKRSVEE